MSYKNAMLMVVASLSALAAGCGEQPKAMKIQADFSTQRPASVSPELENLAKTDHLALLNKCLANWKARGVKDYTCTFIKQERIKGQLKGVQWTDVKFLADPFSVVMNWRRVDDKGQKLFVPDGDKIIYVEGMYDGNMLVRPSLFKGLTVKKKPDCSEALKNTLRPVNYFGFERGLQNLIDVYAAAKKAGDLQQGLGGYTKVDGRDAIVLTRYLPQKKEYPAKKTLIYIDAEWLIPTQIDGTEWDDQFQCHYEYRNIKFNTALTEKDFDPAANEMKKPG